MSTANIHGTALALDGTGILLRGPSGSGKSLLALTLLQRFETAQRPAFLVADDRVDLHSVGGAIRMTAPPALTGRIELRFRGIVERPYLPEARLHLVVDLVPDAIRLLEETDLSTDILGISLPRAPVPQTSLISLGHQEMLVLEAMRASR